MRTLIYIGALEMAGAEPGTPRGRLPMPAAIPGDHNSSAWASSDTRGAQGSARGWHRYPASAGLCPGSAGLCRGGHQLGQLNSAIDPPIVLFRRIRILLLPPARDASPDTVCEASQYHEQYFTLVSLLGGCFICSSG